MVIQTPSALPLHVQISELLTRSIAAGHYAAGDRLPTESQLAAQFNVSIGTLRKALAQLESRGQLERRQGSGTYVKAPHTSDGHNPATSLAGVYGFFRLELLQGGGLPSATVIDFSTVATPQTFRQHFSNRCYRLRRLRSLSHLPIALEEIYFDSRHRPHLLREDLGDALYWFYQEQLGFWISHVEDRIGLGQVPDWSPNLFEPPLGSNVPRIERVAWSGHQRIEEYSITWFDADRCRYVNRMK
jgi:GntR family transcriptional regulator